MWKALSEKTCWLTRIASEPKQWVSSRTVSAIHFPGFAGGQNVADDAPCAFQPAENSSGFLMHGNKARNGAAAFRDGNFLLFALYFIQQREAPRFERARSDLILHDYDDTTEVITTLGW